jgi:pimeloyl-ACP methyl ester carboxylesterase
MNFKSIKRTATMFAYEVLSVVRRLIGVALFAPFCGAALAAGSSPSLTSNTASPQCHAMTVPVSLIDGGPKAYVVSGQLCLPASGQARTVLLTVHGATYDHRYWDWPYEPTLYSFRQFMTNAGYAVFLYDRIGDGQSSHPVSTDISVASDGYVAHQLVQGLRSGQIDGYTFNHVVIVGHSLGSYTSWVEAGLYRDVDGVILTGVAHGMNTNAGSVASADIYPANQGPQFQPTALDAGYLTTRPGKRFDLFYAATTTDPAVVAFDEATKQTVTSTEYGSIFATGPGSPAFDSGLITAPVLLVNGQNDLFFCQNSPVDCSTSSSLQRAEQQYYGASPSMTSFVVPATGHDINLEVTAPLWYGFALQWLVRTAHLTP